VLTKNEAATGVPVSQPARARRQVVRDRVSQETVVLVVAIGLAVAFALTRAHTGDVRVYRAGGLAILRGENLYAVRVGGYGFTYPPFAAVLFATVAWLPLTVMFALLTAASAAAAYVVLRRSAPDLRSGLAPAVGLAVLVVAHPVIGTLAWGQVNLVLAALVLHDLTVRRSGVLVGIATAVKLTPAVFVLYLVMCGRRREARQAVLAFLAASTLGALVAPSASWRYWTHDVILGPGIGGFDHEGNQSVRGLAERALGAGAGTAVWLLLAAPVLAVGLVLARRAAQNGDEVLGAGIAGVTACLVSPVAWIHHWVWCIPLVTRLPLALRVLLGALFVVPLSFGPVIGVGYPILALAAFGVRRWWLPGERVARC
jgi:alpha-1,2-mannosyltransferase